MAVLLIRLRRAVRGVNQAFNRLKVEQAPPTVVQTSFEYFFCL
jgi:hypothetical protein